MTNRICTGLIGLVLVVAAGVIPASAAEGVIANGSFEVPDDQAEVTALQDAIGVSSFDPGLGSLVAMAFDHQTNNLFIYPEHGAEIHEYTTAGSEVGSGIPPLGGSSNDIDLDFATESLSVGGTTVPDNTLLSANGDRGQILYAGDKDDGTLLAQQQMPGGGATGGAYHAGRDSFFMLSYSAAQIYELDPDDGTVLNQFTVAPTNAPPFGTFYSDVDVDSATGNLLIVSSSQSVARQMTPTGEWVGDADLFNENDENDPLRIDAMSGAAIDDATRDVWISTTRGIVWRLTNLWDNFSTGAPCESDPNAICGDEGDDDIQGTPEDDTIYAGDGNDTIDGGGGNDVIFGGGGDDVLVGGAGDDILSGDATAGSPGAYPMGAAIIWPGLQEEAPPGDDVLEGGDGNDQLDGNAGNDTLNGGAGTDAASGGAGADRILGKAGNDKLSGNGGPDVLNAGGGTNSLNGGPGRDTCVLNKKRDKATSCEKQRNLQRNLLPVKWHLAD